MRKGIVVGAILSLELGSEKWSMQTVGSKLAIPIQSQNSFLIEWLFWAVNPRYLSFILFQMYVYFL